MSAGVVIVGAGQCGARAARTLRCAGYDGDVTLIGSERELPYERPPLSKTALTATDPPPPKTLLTIDDLDHHNIVFRDGVSAVDIDRDHRAVVLQDGTRVPYVRLLLATGARPRALPIPAPDGVRFLRSYADSRSIRDALRPGTRVGVVGAGFLGLELAAAAAHRGCEVTVLELGKRPLGRIVPAAIAKAVAERHAAAGVTLLTDVRIDRIDSGRGAYIVILGSDRTLRFDLLVAAVGAVPNTELAAQAGLAVDNGVTVDELLATSDPAIYAAGDCCSFPYHIPVTRRVRLESCGNAADQAEAAARNILGARMPYRRVPWFWSDQYELTLYIAGVPQDPGEPVVRTRRDGTDIHFSVGDDGALVSAAAVAAGNTAAKDIRIAQRLIGDRCVVPPSILTNPDSNLVKYLSHR